MSRYYATATNGRGNTVSIGGRGSAGTVHLRGWDAGVKVVPNTAKGEPDSFDVYMTFGSHAAGKDIRLGTVRDTEEGPLFFPDGVNVNSGKIYRFDGSN